MSSCARYSRIVAAGAALAVVPLGGTAWAAGFQLRELSAEGVATALSGSTAKAGDLSTIYLNPAGMTRFSGVHAQGDASYVMPTINFSGSATGAFGAFSGGDGGDAGEDKLVPAIYGLWSISPTLKAGISVNVPFGLATNYDDDWVGRYFALESEITNYVITPSIAWKPTEQLSLGAGLQIGHADATLSQALNLSPLGLPDGRSELDGDDFGYGVTLGMLYEFTPTSRVGLSYRSRVSYTLEGQADFSGVPEPFATALGLTDSDAEADVTTPDVVSLGAYHELNPKWAVMSEVSWTNWSTFDELRVNFDDGRPDSVTEENWEDSWFFSIGADYKPMDNHTLHFGVAYDQSPVPEEFRTARIPDADRYWLSLGYSYDFGPDRTLNLGYTHIFNDEVDIDETVANVGTLSGDYSGSADIVSASLRFAF
jgi:long-chain fatty acid transport protein